MTTHVGRIVVALALAAGMSGCDSLWLGGGPEGELEENQARWASLSLTSYEYVLRRGCFCPPAFIGPVRVRVEGGVVTDRTYVDVVNPIPGEPGEAFPAVDGLFEILADAYERDAHSIDVTYDPETGVPLDVFIDYQENVADEELGFTVQSLPTPLP